MKTVSWRIEVNNDPGHGMQHADYWSMPGYPATAHCLPTPPSIVYICLTIISQNICIKTATKLLVVFLRLEQLQVCVLVVEIEYQFLSAVVSSRTGRLARLPAAG